MYSTTARSKQTNPGRWDTLSEPECAQVSRLFGVLFERQEEIRVAERVRVRAVLDVELAVDVCDHLGVVVVETWNDHLVEVYDDSVPVAVDITHHTVVERRRTCQFD